MDYWEVRLECLKLARQGGYTIGTAGGLKALKETVEMYYEVVVGDGPAPPMTGAATGTPEGAPTGAAKHPGPSGAGKKGAPPAQGKAPKTGSAPVEQQTRKDTSPGTPADATA